MIRPLRTQHRLLITVLAIVLPLLVALGLLARRPVPTDDTRPGVTEAAP